MLDLQSRPAVQPASAQDWLATQEKLRGDYSTCAADFTMAQDMRAYTPAEHDLWRRLFHRQSEVAKRFAASAFLTGMKNLDMSADRIPNFEEASKRLRQLTGWEIVAVPGLIPDDAFFRHLANRRFPVTVWIREEHEIDYLVEPDVFHDFFGHVPLLTQPIFADYLQEYGRKGDEAMAMGATKILARLFWYMVEFGLIEEKGAIKAYGAGMLSSATETEYSVTSPKPQRLRFDLTRVMGTDFRIDAFQETYFVLQSYDELFAAMKQPFAPLYRQLLATPAIPARTIRAGDTVVSIAA
jgi:phenylalanine-4-hydroxylase